MSGVDVSAAIARLEERIFALARLVDERDKQVMIAFNSAEKASGKAEEAQRTVNTTQNEFRGTLRDQASTLATKEGLDQLDKRVQSLEQGAAGGVGRAGGLTSAQALVFQVLPLLLSAVALIAIFIGKHS